MTTALDIITSAMRKIGVLTKTETPAADESADALQTLNDLLGSWSNDSLPIYARTLENFTLSANTSAYTIGNSATFDTASPVAIISAYIRDGGYDYGVDIISDQDYAALENKTQTGRPFVLSYNNDYPAGTLKFYYTPNQAYNFYILSEKQLTSITALDSVLSLPAGWNRALIYNLAIDLAPEYGQAVTPEIAGIAGQSLSAIKNQVRRARGVDVPSSPFEGNIFTGWWIR